MIIVVILIVFSARSDEERTGKYEHLVLLEQRKERKGQITFHGCLPLQSKVYCLNTMESYAYLFSRLTVMNTSRRSIFCCLSSFGEDWMDEKQCVEQRVPAFAAAAAGMSR